MEEKIETTGGNPQERDIEKGPGRLKKTMKWLSSKEYLLNGLVTVLLATVVNFLLSPHAPMPNQQQNHIMPNQQQNSTYSPSLEGYAKPAGIGEWRNALGERLTTTASDNPEVKALRARAKDALDQSDYLQAENQLNQAWQRSLSKADSIKREAKKLSETADKEFLTAAASWAEVGDLKMIAAASWAEAGNLKMILTSYAAAADYYQQAAELVPVGSESAKADYLNQQGTALYLAGKYPKRKRP
ncbi:MAG: hypothetical protein HQK60_00170 [Deltaproteobacteria bacterium]|nr:hypothetical protein [Deltaproteobacteria bacterium]